MINNNYCTADIICLQFLHDITFILLYTDKRKL